jgi:beta-glucosidase
MARASGLSQHLHSLLVLVATGAGLAGCGSSSDTVERSSAGAAGTFTTGGRANLGAAGTFTTGGRANLGAAGGRENVATAAGGGSSIFGTAGVAVTGGRANAGAAGSYATGGDENAGAAGSSAIDGGESAGAAGMGTDNPDRFERGTPAHRSPSVDAAAPLTQKVASLVAALSLDEKRQLIQAMAAQTSADPDSVGETGYTPGVARLGIPPRRDANALGIDVTLETTAPPAHIGLAATFDRLAANEQGYLVGQEGLARGVDVLNGPEIEIQRLPNWRRNNTTLGEDPYLSGELAAMEISGVQGAGLMANLRQFALDDGQPNQYSIVDDQVAHEIYLAPFAAAIAQAQPASVRCASSQFQLTPVQSSPAWACHNGQLLNVILRQEWGYKGFVVSEFGATHAADLQNGLDQEFASDYLSATWLHSVDGDAAVLAAIDAAVARQLYQLERFGYLNCAAADPAAVLPTCIAGPDRPNMDALAIENRGKVQQIAEKAAVLLKNEGGILPLKATDFFDGVVVIGPTAKYPLVGPGAERSKGFAARNRRGPLVVLKEMAQSSNIEYVAGIDWVGEFPPAGVLTTTDGSQNCLLREDFDGTTSTGAASCDATIDYSTDARPIAVGHKYTWTGKLVAPTSGVYYLWVRLGGGLPLLGSAATLTVDAMPQVLAAVPANANEFDDGLVSNGVALTLTTGAHDIVLTVSNTGSTVSSTPPTGPIYAQFRWSPYEQNLRAAVDAAKKASLAVVFANDAGGSFTGSASVPTAVLGSLDANQDDLITSIASANPRTVVVLQNGQPVAMPWAQAVPAILEIWYPGQEGGQATANLLLGGANPGGRLPVTFPARAEDTPFAGALYDERVGGVTAPAFCGTQDECVKVTWSEGLSVGYRWYDREAASPLFAFGEGLSYTTFAYSQLHADASRSGVEVTFSVQNTGTRAGDAVPQVYLSGSGNLPSAVQVAKKALVGFERVPLNPGQTKLVTVHVTPQQLSYWSSSSQSWVQPAGTRTICLSTSSRDTAIVASVDVVIPE